MDFGYGLNRDALFADESIQFRYPYEPEAGDEVIFRFRTLKDNADAVRLVGRGFRRTMEKAYTEGLFDFYETKLQIGSEIFRYCFEIEKDGQFCVYSRLGPGNELHVQENEFFSVRPGFETPDWAKGAVFYQIFTDRFRNGDPTNDVLNGEYYYLNRPVEHAASWEELPESPDVHRFYGGDLKGVLEKLDYLKYLGIEAIYFNPIFVSPSNHKYDTQDYDHIDPHFGRIVHDEGELLFRPRNRNAVPADKNPARGAKNPRGGAGRISTAGRNSETLMWWPDATQGLESLREEELSKGTRSNRKASRYLCRVTDPANLEASDRLFAHLVEEAHRRGIRVILDGVFNHCGSFHRWLDAEKIYEQLPGGKKGARTSKRSPYADYFKFESDR